MASRKSPLISALFKLGRAGMKQSARIGKAATKQGLAHGSTFAKAAGEAMSGVPRRADSPDPRPAGGRWYEGRWGLGPLAMRSYRLFIPIGASARRPVPLLVLLHGCAQDSATFAAVTHAASVARERGFAVLMPEQAREANPQRCWNWFGGDTRVGLEVQIIMALVDRVHNQHPRCAGPLFALGISAGGAMALTLALQHPDRFQAVGSHSGAAPHSAATPLQAGQAMRGRRSPDLDAVARDLHGRRLPPLILIHGDCDGVVAFDNARASAALWLDLLPENLNVTENEGEIRRGSRLPCSRHDWRLARQPYVRLLRVRGLTHAWSGGASGHAFSEPRGPDALKMAWQFFAATMEKAAPA